MKEARSKKTGKIQIWTEEEYAQVVRKPELLKRFIVTDLRTRPVINPQIPTLNEKIKVKTKKKNDG